MSFDYSMLTPEQWLLAGASGSVPLLLYSSEIKSAATVILNIRLRGSKSKFAFDKSEIQIGRIKLTDEDRMRHTHIIGATGSGKTVLIEHLLYRDLARGYGAIIIDAKGERAFYEKIRAYCKSIGREADLHLLSSTYEDESVKWNPCRLGNLSELQSKFHSAGKYDHPFFSKVAEFVLIDAFNRILKNESDEVDLYDLLQVTNKICRDGKDENTKGTYYDMQNLAQGEWGGILGMRPKIGNNKEISILDLTRKNEILFVDLPTEGKSVQSGRIGALMLQEITLLSGIRKRMPAVRSHLPFSIFIDEFDSFASEQFITFLNKGRSSDFMIHMAHQTLSDLKKVSETFEGQVTGNPNVRFYFRVDNPDDAESISRSLGTKKASKKTQQTDAGGSTGRGTQRETQEFKIHPDKIKELKIGECVASVKTHGFLEVLKIPMLSEKTVPHFKLPVHREEMKERNRDDEQNETDQDDKE